MPLILGLIGFIFATFLAFAWVAVWLVAAVVWLLWPLALLLLGCVAWRRQSRYWQQWQPVAASTAGQRPQPSARSSNSAFDEYREETLHRLDEEREKFREFLERRRRDKDREAFESYIAERWGRHSNGPQGAIS